MRKIADTLLLSASDLVGHLNCRYLTELDLAVARGELAKPVIWDPLLDLLVERGNLHERGYLDHLTASGLTPVIVEGVGISRTAVAQTLDAMKAGAPIIAQGALETDRWSGRADVLRRVEKASRFGSWSYEVIDTKLARETKGNTILQLSLYSDLLGGAQERTPEFAYVVAPGSNFEPQRYRIADYAAYYRLVKAGLERAVEQPVSEAYPDPKPHCDICRWRTRCDAKRRQDDHLSLVAGISKVQINELARRDITTMAELAVLPTPLQWRPERGAAQSYERVREQARIQVRGRSEAKLVFEPLAVSFGFGLTRLPLPSPGDIFFDFEGDPFVEGGGLEFLFGYAVGCDAQEPEYIADWALTRTDERRAFETFVDFVIRRLERFPDLHVYHFSPYEPATLKRLMGRYATREQEIDRLLRSEIFVDLYAVVRHAIRASVESYSIKKLEPLYHFERRAALRDAGMTLAKVQASLELGDLRSITEDDRSAVQAYNRDDCVSTWRLRDWLEEIRLGLIQGGAVIDRPARRVGDPTPDVSAWQKRIDSLVSRLTDGTPPDPHERSDEQQSKWILAHILDWHRRELKAAWWEHFRLRDLSAHDLLEERAGLSGLAFVQAAGGTAKAPIHRYSFPAQETEMRGGEEIRMLGGEKFGKVEAISLEERTIDIKKRQDTAGVHPDAVYAHKVISAEVMAEALVRLGEYVADNRISGDGPFQAGRDLLMLAKPRIGDHPLRMAGETTLHAAIRIAPLLDRTVLPIQGPPGAGKTHTGACMIQTLAKAGKKSGITANSHKVIRNLLDKVIEVGIESGSTIRCIEKVSEEEDDIVGLQLTTDNAKLFAGIAGDRQVAAGTAWLWARPEAFETLDVLFIDEAAQMSLANVLAVSQAARSIVLLGDPRQLEQPMQGTHPEGTDVSALDHILGAHATIPANRGLFLEETWRLHPDICAFTSEVFYEDRLHSLSGLEKQGIGSNGRISGAGLRVLPVPHEGNQSSSPEEADQICALVMEILGSATTWINRDGEELAITLDDILIIAPYNAQVFELRERIPGARIGTVDKFQGQEAPIVIYSMTTSTHADAPRGMEFLYSPNRLNVATSRAKCICILVAAPPVFEPECRTPRHMQLANACCRYLEMASSV
jgi:predicted RecB family nuclease